MKRVIISFVAIVAMITMSNAQVFVGGSVGIGTTGGKAKSGGISIDYPSTFTIDFSPKVGFFLSDDLSVGLDITFQNTKTTTPKYSGNDDRVVKSTAFGIGAFGRYKIAEAGNLAFLVEGDLGFLSAKSKTTIGSTTTEGDPVSVLYFGVLPVLSYELTSSLSLEANCNFLRLGFASYTVKDVKDKDNKTTSNAFELGANGYTLTDLGSYMWTPVQIGLIFKF